MDDGALDELPDDEMAALQLLFGLGEHGLVDIVGTTARSARHIVVKDNQGAPEVFVSDDVEGYGLPLRLSDEARGPLTSPFNGNPNDPAAEELYSGFLRTKAHTALRRDLFVTYSDCLLRHRGHNWLCDINIRRPSEALRILGLLLRSRSDFTYFASGVMTARTSRSEFYRTLAQTRLGDYWKLHFSKPASLGLRVRDDRWNRLSWSVISKLARAYEARDRIGEIYFGTRADLRDEGDLADYHFTFLLQLVSGAIDAFVRIADGVFAPKFKGRPSPRSSSYLTALERAGADALVADIRTSSTQAVLALVASFRNLIHEADVEIRVTSTGHPGALVPYEEAIRLWCAARQLTSPDDFGLLLRTWGKMIRNGVEDTESERFEIVADLYLYASALVREVAQMIERLSQHVIEPDPEHTTSAFNRWLEPARFNSRPYVDLLG